MRSLVSQLQTRIRHAKRSVMSSPAFHRAAESVVYRFLKTVHATNPLVTDLNDSHRLIGEHAPVIWAMWHGQHFMVPFYWPQNVPVDALISRNRDAEINARFLRRFGIGTVRGSGGRDERQNVQRGGAKALLELRRALQQGRSVAMIADISHLKARQAGAGIVTLARISGRPIIPVAVTTSRQFIFRNSWDKAALSLPFGRAAVVLGGAVHVGPDDDLDAKRAEVSAALDAVTARAEQLVARQTALQSGASPL